MRRTGDRAYEGFLAKLRAEGKLGEAGADLSDDAVYREFAEASGIAELVPGFDLSAGADLAGEEEAERTDLTAEEESSMYSRFVEASGLEELLGRPVDTSADAPAGERADLAEEAHDDEPSDDELYAAVMGSLGREEG